MFATLVGEGAGNLPGSRADDGNGMPRPILRSEAAGLGRANSLS